MPEDVETGTLRQRRFRKLLRALYNNGKGLSQPAIATELGISQALVSAIILGDKHGGEESIDKAKRAMRIHEDYFSVEDISPYTTHEPFVGRSPLRATETRLVLDEHPAIARFEEEEGRPVSQRAREHLALIARNDGPDAITNEVVHRIEDAAKAVDRGTRVRRPIDPENVIDEKAGQVKAPERGRKR